jgi:hypothetical protein
LQGLKITQPDQVWFADVTNVGLPEAIWSRLWIGCYVLAWELSNMEIQCPHHWISLRPADFRTF